MLALLACSGGSGPLSGSGDAGSPSDATGGSSGSSSGGSGSSSGSASSSSGGGSGGGSSSGSGSSSGGGGDATFPCPDISGGYGQITATGQGCGNFNTMAPECIMLAQQICAFQLVSATSGVTPAVNGVVILQSDGSFSNAALQFGTAQRTGCTGQWDAASQTLTMDCGGMGSSQSCVVTIKRSGATCQ